MNELNTVLQMILPAQEAAIATYLITVFACGAIITSLMALVKD